MNRRDYRKLMNVKKRNKNYAKLTILASLGLGVALANSTTVKAETRDWTPNTSTTIKQGDKQYTIKWGDYLSLISKDSGLTIETLMKLNDSILDADLIYEGNIIYFGDGVNAVVKDSKGNTIASIPLTEADKAGIKQADAQKVNRASKTENKKNNNSKVNVVNNGNGTGTVTKPNPTKPVNPTTPITKPDEGKPKPSVKPNAQEVSMKVYYLQVASADDLENAVILKEETVKAKKGEKVTIEAKEFENMNLISEPSITVTAEKDAEIIFDYVHKDAREVTVRSITEDGTILDEFIETDFDILVGEEVSYIAGEYEGYELISPEEQTITVNTENTKNVIEFVYREKTVEPIQKEYTITINYQTEDGEILSSETRKAKEGTTVNTQALDFSDRGYELVGESNQSVEANSNQTITYTYKKVKDVDPTNEDKFVTVNLDTDGNDLGEKVDTTKFEEVSRKTDKTVETLENGNTVTTYITTITWNAKDEKPYEPVHTNETVVVNVDTNGTVLSDTTGYNYVSESTDKGVVTTADNGDTHTVFTKTVVWEKAYVPVHTSETVVVNVDVNGTVLADTSNYDYVSESTDGGKVTTQPNGDTHTVFTKTVVWKVKEVAPTNPYVGQQKEVIRGEYNGTFYEGIGNSGMVWGDQMTASLWAITEIANNGNGGSYLTWQVRVAGTNEIMWTAHLK